MATSVQYAILAGYTLFPTGCRPHKPEQGVLRRNRRNFRHSELVDF